MTYLPVTDRTASLADIDATMQRIAERIRKGIPGAYVHPTRFTMKTQSISSWFELDDVQVKIEITPVLRGCVYETEVRAVSPSVEDRFGYAKYRLCLSPTYTRANLLPRWIASIPVTCLMCATFLPTRALMTC